ncbi:hypothetical protein [Thermomonas sp.]|uniref:hypothetical protein n=1 Tax=Thermomonas sp. TaxID=1971895 RepID=UPI00263627F0|nr:hypothetical protein [Thermomonas sp.]MCO5054671.1 hypothetical protein [Thermomonas sp.]
MWHLQADRRFTLTALVRRFVLAEAIRHEIERRRKLAIGKGFQTSLPGFVCAPPQGRPSAMPSASSRTSTPVDRRSIPGGFASRSTTTL